MERNGTKLAREFAYMSITPRDLISSSPAITEKKKKKKEKHNRVSHSLEKLDDRSRSNSPMRQSAVLYGTPLRTHRLMKQASKRVSDTAVYANMEGPAHYAVTYCGQESDYANMCMLDSPHVVLVKESGSAEGRIETTHQDGKTSPNVRSRSQSFRNSLRSASFMRFLRRGGKEASRRSRSDGSFDQDLSQTKPLNFRRERSISLPIKCGEEEFHRGPAFSPEPRTCEQATQVGESPKRFHTIHENSFRVRAPRTVTCAAPLQGFDLPKQRTEIETQKAVRHKSRSFSHKHDRPVTSLGTPVVQCASVQCGSQCGSQCSPRTGLRRHNSTGGEYAEWGRRKDESPPSESRTKLGSQLDCGDYLPGDKYYGKIVALDDKRPLDPRRKEYAKVKRRSERLESSETEVSSSPVFDLDMSGDSQEPEPLYVNIPVRVPDRSPNYVNVDFTPPHTPPQYSPQPMELINPLLNYAEMDMSPSGRNKPRISMARSPPSYSPLNYVGIERVDSQVKKVMRIVDQAPGTDLRKARVEPTSEYAQIDVDATVAIQHVFKDRRQNRSPQLAAKERKPFINREALLVRDRKGSVP